MSAIEVAQFLGRARDFLKGVDILSYELAEYRYSSALLGIHCAIAYSDALRYGLGSVKLSSEDHKSAARDLRSRLASRKFENLQGADRLEKLLSRKSRVAYSAEDTTENLAEEIVKQAQRFAKWAEDTGRELRIEGW